MLHDIASLKLQGANFDELKELSLFYFKDKPKPKTAVAMEFFYMEEMEPVKVQLPNVLER